MLIYALSLIAALLFADPCKLVDIQRQGCVLCNKVRQCLRNISPAPKEGWFNKISIFYIFDKIRINTVPFSRLSRSSSSRSRSCTSLIFCANLSIFSEIGIGFFGCSDDFEASDSDLTTGGGVFAASGLTSASSSESGPRSSSWEVIVPNWKLFPLIRWKWHAKVGSTATRVCRKWC